VGELVEGQEGCRGIMACGYGPERWIGITKMSSLCLDYVVFSNSWLFRSWMLSLISAHSIFMRYLMSGCPRGSGKKMNERDNTPFGAWPHIIVCIRNSTRNKNHQPDMFAGFVLELISSHEHCVRRLPHMHSCTTSL
jgi:hypothetical protein